MFIAGPDRVKSEEAAAQIRAMTREIKVGEIVDGRIVKIMEFGAIVDLGGPVEALRRSVRDLRIYSGYAGWGPGQLRRELRSGAWWVFDSQPSDWFSTEPERLWNTVLQRQGGRWRLWANAPDDPEVN